MSVKVTIEKDPKPFTPPATPVTLEDEVIDSRGRRLKIKEPEILQESRLVRIMGEAAMNAAYMTGYVLPAAMVVAIDGEDLPFPATAAQVDAAIVRLGREGMTAVMQHVTSKTDDAERTKTEIKN